MQVVSEVTGRGRGVEYGDGPSVLGDCCGMRLRSSSTKMCS